MARQKSTGKSRAKKKLSVKKQPVKYLDVPKHKGPKGGLTSLTSSPTLSAPMLRGDKFIKAGTVDATLKPF